MLIFNSMHSCRGSHSRATHHPAAKTQPRPDRTVLSLFAVSYRLRHMGPLKPSRDQTLLSRDVQSKNSDVLSYVADDVVYNPLSSIAMCSV